jgi:hypothetical protein
LIDALIKLTKKKEQSAYVILNLIKFCIRDFVPQMEKTKEVKLQQFFFMSLKNIFESLKPQKSNEKFEKFQKQVIKALENTDFKETCSIIEKCDLDLEDIKFEIRIKHKKKLSLGESSYNTEGSTGLGNKLEISIGGGVSSTRNLTLTSPSNKIIKSETSSNLKLIYNDHIKFTKITQKLPYLSLAVDITLSSTQIKKIFIQEMKK